MSIAVEEISIVDCGIVVKCGKDFILAISGILVVFSNIVVDPGILVVDCAIEVDSVIMVVGSDLAVVSRIVVGGCVMMIPCFKVLV